MMSPGRPSSANTPTVHKQYPVGHFADEGDIACYDDHRHFSFGKRTDHLENVPGEFGVEGVDGSSKSRSAGSRTRGGRSTPVAAARLKAGRNTHPPCRTIPSGRSMKGIRDTSFDNRLKTAARNENSGNCGLKSDVCHWTCSIPRLVIC
jgi:hypothetical protein